MRSNIVVGLLLSARLAVCAVSDAQILLHIAPLLSEQHASLLHGGEDLGALEGVLVADIRRAEVAAFRQAGAADAVAGGAAAEVWESLFLVRFVQTRRDILREMVIPSPGLEEAIGSLALAKAYGMVLWDVSMLTPIFAAIEQARGAGEMAEYTQGKSEAALEELRGCLEYMERLILGLDGTYGRIKGVFPGLNKIQLEAATLASVSVAELRRVVEQVGALGAAGAAAGEITGRMKIVDGALQEWQEVLGPRHLRGLMYSLSRCLQVEEVLFARAPSGGGDECVICIDQAGEDGGVVDCSLSCGHVFHRKCARTWLFNQDSCPTCRANVVNRDDGRFATGPRGFY